MRSFGNFALSIIGVVLAFMVTFYGCKKDKEEENPQPPENEIVIADNAKIIDSTQLTNLQVVGNTYTYSITGGTPTFAPDDIISGAAHGGYLKWNMVTNIQHPMDGAKSGKNHPRLHNTLYRVYSMQD